MNPEDIELNRTRRNLIKNAGAVAAGVGLTAAGAGLVAAEITAGDSALNKELAGKTAFITGAARGIGRAIAETYAKAGANVAMIDIADPSRLSGKGYRVATMAEFDEAVEAVQALGTKVLKIQADVRSLQEMQNAAKRAHEELDGIDIVVANAGFVQWHSFEDGTPEDWKKVYDVNVHGVFNTSKSALPFLKQNGGRIINMTSIGGRAGFAGNGAYTSSKWAVIGLTKQAASELGPHNIAVNAIAPGPVDTPMYRSDGQMAAMGVSTAEEQDAVIGGMLPLGDRPVASPQDIADTALFLAGDGAKTISGTVIDDAFGFNASYTA